MQRVTGTAGRKSGAETEDGQRSYRVRVAVPHGLSYARDIAEKYGVTYEQLSAGRKK